MEHRQRDRILIVEHAAHAIVLGAHFNPGQIPQAHQFAIGAGLDDDGAELILGGKPPGRIQGDLKLGALGRRRAKLAGCHIQVLFANRADDITRREIADRQFFRIQPYAHGVIAATEYLNLPHARQAREHVADIQYGVVAQVQRVIASAGRDEIDQHGQVRGALDRRHAQVTHFLRQARQRLGDAVLHLHLRAVRIGTDLERHGHIQRAVHGRGGRHVEHVVNAHDRLFQRCSHRIRDDLGISSRVVGVNHDRGRHNFGVLTDRQPDERQGTGDGDEGGDDGREYRPFDKEF